MRERVLTALHLAKDPTPPMQTHRLNTWNLARTVLLKNQAYQWQLFENPQRLRILTIDSLCAELSRCLPILTGSGAPTRIVEDATPFYQQAVNYVISHLTPKELLSHLDNQVATLQRLCTDMLLRREQWLPYIIAKNPSLTLRNQLEQGLWQLVAEVLQMTDAHIERPLKSQLLILCKYAAKNLYHERSGHALTAWKELLTWPIPTPQNLNIWQGLASLLLTKEGKWRRKVDVRLGFPPKTAEKQVIEELLVHLADDEILAEHLNHIISCPPIHYTDSQWHIISALIELLPLLAAQLQLVFQQHGVMDFIELNLSASRALGEEDQPTDLALSLDYRIQHILVDEFQDTSVVQFKLLEKLIAGWQAGDGRSVFLVGDPMQSIYRFRNAEVSLFIRTTRFGIGTIPLVPLSLKLNFRSGQEVIHWFNQVFPHILAQEADLTIGAIPYTAVTATETQVEPTAINCYGVTDTLQEAQQIVKLINHYRQKNDTCKIAILVRSRQQLAEITTALHAAQISFQAVDIEPLAECSEIEDLIALTQALLHRGDRIAWLSVLRAPYCGLTLADLHVIAQDAKFQPIYASVLNFQQLRGLSEDGRQRLSRITPALSEGLLNRGRFSLSEWIEGVWLTLGGPASLNDLSALHNARSFFQLINDIEPDFNISLLKQKLGKLYAAPNPHGDARLQIMTIHKAKGLEFDHVILPGLNRKTPSDSHQLLMWLERANAVGGSHLILAPIKETAAAFDPIYDYLRHIEQKKLMHEASRLLYVAATRAKQSLHLLAVLPTDADIEDWQPATGCFLAMLWPYFQEQLPGCFSAVPAQTGSKPQSEFRLLHRLSQDWQLPALPNGEQYTTNIAVFNPSIPIAMTLIEKRAAVVGTVIHEALATLPKNPHPDDHWRQRFLKLGITAPGLEESVAIVAQALQRTLKDPRGQWILSNQHQIAYNEVALSALVNNQIVHVIIDRMFIDSNGVCWIIDYKTSQPLPGVNLQIFMQQEMQNYAAQLLRYREVVELKENRPIRLGLYFPLCSGWLELK